MLSLLNILSSFPALYEALNQPQPKEQDIPSTVFVRHLSVSLVYVQYCTVFMHSTLYMYSYMYL